jgi:hypothetical protein
MISAKTPTKIAVIAQEGIPLLFFAAGFAAPTVARVASALSFLTLFPFPIFGTTFFEIFVYMLRGHIRADGLFKA